MKKFAVIGSPISHSLSPQIHSLFAKQAQIEISYEAIEIIQSDFNSKVNQLFQDGYSGVNVTLPLKEIAFHYADKKSEEALLAESVNTLFLKDSSVCGETTDGEGLLLDLQSKGIELKGSNVVILGAGGSARAVIPSLLSSKQNNPEINQIEMDESINFEIDLVVNSTSAGTLGEELVLPEGIFSTKTKSYDLSYSEEITPFNLMAKKSGIKEVYDGLGMLIHQAALSFEMWNTFKPSTEGIEQKIRP
jgi:shikimate dehydrogenase